MLPTAATQLLVAVLLVALWYRWYRHCKARALRERESRQQVAAQRGGYNADNDAPPPKAVLVEQEPAIDVVADSTSTATEEPEPLPRIPTGVTCVVGKGRKLLRCTEFEVTGELQTEVVRVTRRGRTIGEGTVRSGSYRDVASELLNLKAA
jgi:hypothetical protein